MGDTVAPLAVVVVGPGRGQLVIAVRNAAKRSSVEVRVWAVEKNQYAVVSLRHRCRLENWENVEVVGLDFREWEPPHSMDVLVSELLGAFGDNELAPECLGGAGRMLAPDGVCIPRRCCSFLTPVMSPKLWNKVRHYDDVAHMESPYVVKFHQAFFPCTDIEPCFCFEHPSPDGASHDRYASIDFVTEMDCVVHGFAGYFNCELEDGLTLSTIPGSQCEGTITWFSMFFPLREPMCLPRSQHLQTHWWRLHDERKVWYEWAVSKPTVQPIHNPGGRSFSVLQ